MRNSFHRTFLPAYVSFVNSVPEDLRISNPNIGVRYAKLLRSANAVTKAIAKSFNASNLISFDVIGLNGAPEGVIFNFKVWDSKYSRERNLFIKWAVKPGGFIRIDYPDVHGTHSLEDFDRGVVLNIAYVDVKVPKISKTEFSERITPTELLETCKLENGLTAGVLN